MEQRRGSLGSHPSLALHRDNSRQPLNYFDHHIILVVACGWGPPINPVFVIITIIIIIIVVVVVVVVVVQIDGHGPH